MLKSFRSKFTIKASSLGATALIIIFGLIANTLRFNKTRN